MKPRCSVFRSLTIVLELIIIACRPTGRSIENSLMIEYVLRYRKPKQLVCDTIVDLMSLTGVDSLACIEINQ